MPSAIVCKPLPCSSGGSFRKGKVSLDGSRVFPNYVSSIPVHCIPVYAIDTIQYTLIETQWTESGNPMTFIRSA